MFADAPIATELLSIVPANQASWDEAAGFTEVSHPSLQRVVMRIDFA